MAQSSQELWSVAHDLYAHEPVGQVRCTGSGIRFAAWAKRAGSSCRGTFSGQHQCEGASGRNRRFKKLGPQAIGISRGGRTTKVHLVAASNRQAVIFSLSEGSCHDAPEGRKLIGSIKTASHCHLLMDRAYEDDATRGLATKQGFTPVVPPKSNRREPWEYDKELYKRRNEVERLFRRIKRFRRIFTRYEKLDRMFLAFITLAIIVDNLC